MRWGPVGLRPPPRTVAAVLVARIEAVQGIAAHRGVPRAQIDSGGIAGGGPAWGELGVMGGGYGEGGLWGG